MQSKLSGILLVVVVALIAVCGWQFQQLTDVKHKLVEAQKAQENAAAARESREKKIQTLERQRANLENQVADLASETAMLRAVQAKSLSKPQKTGTDDNGVASNSDEGTNANPFGGKGMGKMLQNMMKDPAMKEMIKAQQKVTLNMMWGGFLKESDLTQEQKDKFSELMAENQMKAVESAGDIFEDGAARTNAIASAKEREKQLDADLKELLGDKYPEYQDYKKTLADRMQLNQFRTALEGTDHPLQDGQMKQLLTIMKEQRAAVPPVFAGDNSSEDWKRFSSDDALAKHFKWQEDYNQRVLAAAAGILSPEQIKELEASQKQHLEMQKLGMKMARQMLGGTNSTSVPK